ncbi:hypothetical protein ACH4FX_12550 [Streptomyces sp. NPDC018019]|uniref:hypothetical protein n=1 Tax=Streptomyces sp. NPDC018019 TaxID=3365030 RepID=UPI0037B3F325
MPRAAAGRLRARIGRRGTFLLVIGIGKVCWGSGFVVEPQSAPQGLGLLTGAAPLHCWGWLWVTAGLATAGSAFLRVGRDRFGFAAALIPPATWAIAYTVAVLIGDYPRGGYVALWYLTSHVGVILWASGVPEHSLPEGRT